MKKDKMQKEKMRKEKEGKQGKEQTENDRKEIVTSNVGGVKYFTLRGTVSSILVTGLKILLTEMEKCSNTF